MSSLPIAPANAKVGFAAISRVAINCYRCIRMYIIGLLLKNVKVAVNGEFPSEVLAKGRAKTKGEKIAARMGTDALFGRDGKYRL